jgi:uncharacterized protein (TIGR02145 family)
MARNTGTDKYNRFEACLIPCSAGRQVSDLLKNDVLMKYRKGIFKWVWTFSLTMLVMSGCMKDVQKPEVTTGTVSGVLTTSALIEGNTTGDGGGRVIARGVCFSNYIAEPYILKDNLFYQGSGAGSFNVYLENLTPGTTYYARAFATNAEGTGYGQVVTFTTRGSMTGAITFNPDTVYNTVTDITGNVYNTIRIGGKTWMAENLRTTSLSDGTAIPEVKAGEEWETTQEPAYCWYLNDDKYKDIYGALYNWHTVASDKLCPEGWHVPKYDEWMELFSHFGNNYEVADKLREAGDSHWVKTGPNVRNESGFTVLPGGWRNIDNINFGDLGYAGTFWAVPQTGGDINTVMFFFMGSWEGIFNARNPGNAGLSVRCVKN